MCNESVSKEEKHILNLNFQTCSILQYCKAFLISELHTTEIIFKICIWVAVMDGILLNSKVNGSSLEKL